MKILELFSGTQSISSIFAANGWDTFTIEKDGQFEEITTWTVDALTVTAADILEKFGKPDVIWASPPCESFSVAVIGRNWKQVEGGFEPKHERAELGLNLLNKTLELIKELQPMYYFIENPRGMMRKMPQMQELPRYTVTYCQYGENRMKPTDIWTNHEAPNFRPMCRNGAPCHEAAPRGSRTGVQGQKNAKERSRIPKQLCEHIYSLCENLSKKV